MPESAVFLKDFTPVFNIDSLAKASGLDAASIKELAQEAQEAARPAGGAQVSSLELGAGDEVVIAQVKFVSPFLKDRLDGLHRVFPYIVTEGQALARWGNQYKNSEKKPVVHLIRQACVKQCEQALERLLCEKFALPVLSSINPGSLQEWPLTEQKLLFKALQPLPESLGISLLATGIMQPDYTVSGVFYQTDKKIYNCQFCPRDDCPNRKAPKEKSV